MANVGTQFGYYNPYAGTGPMAMAKAASTAKTMGEWLSINAGLKKAIDSGDVAKINVVIKRITQYTGEANEPTESTGNEL